VLATLGSFNDWHPSTPAPQRPSAYGHPSVTHQGIYTENKIGSVLMTGTPAPTMAVVWAGGDKRMNNKDTID